MKFNFPPESVKWDHGMFADHCDIAEISPNVQEFQCIVIKSMLHNNYAKVLDAVADLVLAKVLRFIFEIGAVHRTVYIRG